LRLGDFQPAPPQSPVIVKIIEPPPETLADIAMRALGVTGLLVLAAILLGVLLAGLMIWIRSRP